jgi:hypothetical protein
MYYHTGGYRILTQGGEVCMCMLGEDRCNLGRGGVRSQKGQGPTSEGKGEEGLDFRNLVKECTGYEVQGWVGPR